MRGGGGELEINSGAEKEGVTGSWLTYRFAAVTPHSECCLTYRHEFMVSKTNQQSNNSRIYKD